MGLSASSSEREFSPEEVAQHGKPNDCWLTIDGGVYDVSEYAVSHPGGAKFLLDYAGGDASEGFRKQGHTSKALELLDSLRIGKLAGWVNDSAPGSTPLREAAEDGIVVLYGSQKGTGRGFAEALAKRLPGARLLNMRDVDPEDLPKVRRAVLVVSTYEGGGPPQDAKFFVQWLKEALHDWRVDKKILSGLLYAVFGLGNSVYADNYNACARTLDQSLRGLGARRFAPLTLGDGNVAREGGGTLESDFEAWSDRVFKTYGALRSSGTSAKAVDDMVASFNEDVGESKGSDRKQDATADTKAAASASKKRRAAPRRVTARAPAKSAAASGVVDLEDLGAVMQRQQAASEEAKQKASDPEYKREMLTPALRKNLKKQGYRLIGSHSGVKLCRWTKAMLRGRGGCYKHTFYGIKSYQCMETTPSLACANKCTFCWRHHTNPVGREWRWKMDEAKKLVDGAIKNHQQLIKTMRGVPGVKPERFQEAMTVRHCALSLVGEPIMYPQINEFLELLHSKSISSFLVTNAQFPERIRQLNPCTQLYVSIDAATRDTLKAVDRPLFSDFWERFTASLRALKKKQSSRTVYRLTLVKEWNMGEVEAYCRLIALGLPLLIEIKAVTFCGSNKASSLTIKNTPYHQEVCEFAQQICKQFDAMFGGQDGDAPRYEIACEHEHSNCVLVADTRLKRGGVWHTWINYPKFHTLQREWKRTGKDFSAMDYTAPTPPWAVYGAKEQGFDPAETRVRRKGKYSKKARAQAAEAKEQAAEAKVQAAEAKATVADTKP